MDEVIEGRSKFMSGHDGEEKAVASERFKHHTNIEIPSKTNEKREPSKLRAFSGKGYRSIGKSGSISKAFGLDTHVIAD
jgi:hypothetical protein